MILILVLLGVWNWLPTVLGRSLFLLCCLNSFTGQIAVLLSIDDFSFHLVVYNHISSRGLLIVLELALHLVARILSSFFAETFFIHHAAIFALAHILLCVHCFLLLEMVVLDSLIVLPGWVFITLMHLLLVLLQSCRTLGLCRVLPHVVRQSQPTHLHLSLL